MSKKKHHKYIQQIKYATYIKLILTTSILNIAAAKNTVLVVKKVNIVPLLKFEVSSKILLKSETIKTNHSTTKKSNNPLNDFDLELNRALDVF